MDEHRAGAAVDGEQIAGARPAEQAATSGDQRQARGAAIAIAAARRVAGHERCGPRATAAIATNAPMRSASQIAPGRTDERGSAVMPISDAQLLDLGDALVVGPLGAPSRYGARAYSFATARSPPARRRRDEALAQPLIAQRECEAIERGADRDRRRRPSS